ncbi:MAG TPA: kelch repeat-containing protein [Planctomycetota bacterium]|nr:kelch repeat-containing protein [Planctomycetota bacterium]
MAATSRLSVLPALLASLCAGGALAGDAPPAAGGGWTKAAEGHGKHRQGATLVWAADLKKILLVGDGVEAFDPAANSWAEFSAAKPGGKDGIQPCYQTAYDAKTKKVYCLSLGNVLHVFDLEAKTWKANPPEPLLDNLSWHMLAGDGQGRLVAVGSDKKYENVGWTRTVVYEAAAGTWATLPLPPDDVVKRHKELVAGSEALIDLVGRIRLAWYRDPKGVGTDEELKALVERCEKLAAHPGVDAFKADLAKVNELIKAKTTLEALKAARAIQPRLDDAAFAQYPVPHSRRNAPLVYDEKNKLFVLFGGDHEDFQVNDTWTLDLEKKAWKRMNPDKAPAPRAGHAACYLPKSGRVAVYEGYAPSGSGDYGANPWQVLDPRELWVYDAKADRWDLAGSWGKAGTAQGDAPPPVGNFFGYSATWYEVPAMAADGDDRVCVAVRAGKNAPAATWTLSFDAAKLDAAGRDKLGTAPNGRRLRAPYFRADYSEVADDSKPTDLDKLPANQWVELKPGPRVPTRGCRQRDWSTTAWDSDRDQVLMWGGGHCVRSSSVPLHYSPVSNRIVEGYDADEPYCYNGWCGPASSLLNKPWIDTHAYHLYAYDPKCKLMVNARGFLYDPERMDWVREEPAKLPYRYSWGGVVIASSPHGAVAWAVANDKASLWLFDRQKGWTPLDPKGALFGPYCDSHGMAYDSKRDRMLMGSVGATYGKQGNGTFLAFDFKTKSVEPVTPENTDVAKIGNSRELTYVAHADWMIVSELYRHGDPKTGKTYLRVYDCEKNKWFLLDAGAVGTGWGAGWSYDARRKLVHCFTFNGQAWTIRLDPATAKLIEKPE